MKILSVSLVALTAALLLAPAARAETTPGWYSAAGVGIGFPQDPTMFAGGAKRSVSDDKNALALFKSFGYSFDNGLRLEAEYFHEQVNTKQINNAPGFGHVINKDLFFNAFYDFNNKSLFTPYVGAGFGVDFVSLSHVGSATAGLTGDEVVGAYQGIVGFSAKIDHNWAVTADYRYVGAFDPKTTYTGGTKGRISDASQVAMFGIRYSFGADEPAAVQPVEAPAVKPHKAAKTPVAAVENNFTVFFDFDKSTLTPEAKKIVAAAAKEFQKGGLAKIDVTGHTDTMGTEAYNKKLSQRRAAAVKAELATLGVAAANIKEVGVGKNGLLVPTTDGVREAQNRRAEIVLSK
jgi:OmpA-OmpF porin, OOP family